MCHINTGGTLKWGAKGLNSLEHPFSGVGAGFGELFAPGLEGRVNKYFPGAPCL